MEKITKAYMKHLGIPLPSLRMAYEIDRENRRVHIVSDGFDSVLLKSLCRMIEEQEDVCLIGHTIKGEPRIEYSITIEMWNERFSVELQEIYAPQGQDGATAVSLRRGVRQPGSLSGRIKILDDDDPDLMLT